MVFWLIKMAITRQIEVGINSNLLHSISTSICIRKCNKIFWRFWSHFLEKSMAVIFPKMAPKSRKIFITFSYTY